MDVSWLLSLVVAPMSVAVTLLVQHCRSAPTKATVDAVASAAAAAAATAAAAAAPQVSSSPVTPLPEIPTVSPQSPTSSLLRQRFHIPTRWSDNAHFRELLDARPHTDETSNLATVTIARLIGTLQATGYDTASGSAALKHDYVCFMMEDVLRSKDHAFLSERDLRLRGDSHRELARYIGNGQEATPDIILGHLRQHRLIDVYVGAQLPASDVTQRYQINPPYTVHLIRGHTNFFAHDLRTQLPDLFSEDKLTFLEKNFRIFDTEWQYWRSCSFELGHTLRTECANIALVPFDFPPDFQKRKQMLHDGLMAQFHHVIASTRYVDYAPKRK